MSQNNRPLEIKSLKGPRRKLKLQLIDGKRYISKRDLQHYFFDQQWRISDFQYHFGLGHRIVRGSLYKWFTPDEIDKSHRNKIAHKQRTSNSNQVNWYRPRKVKPLEELLEAIKQCSNKKALKEYLNMTSWDLSYLQQFYNFRLPKKNKLIDYIATNHLTEDEVQVLAKVIKGLGLTDKILSVNPHKVTKAIEELLTFTYEIRIILRKLRKLYRKELYESSYKPIIPTNVTEYRFAKTLINRGVQIETQKFFPELNIHVDFYLPQHNIILEVDGREHKHKSQEDRDRDKFLKSQGYTVVRIPLDKRLKDPELCLKKYLYPLLKK